jgi:polar amino acid transport system ATP-binding protein
VANEVCFLQQGKLIEKGPPGQIFTEPREEETRRFLRRAL